MDFAVNVRTRDTVDLRIINNIRRPYFEYFRAG
jgi:hypothetical protein